MNTPNVAITDRAALGEFLPESPPVDKVFASIRALFCMDMEESISTRIQYLSLGGEGKVYSTAR